VSIPNQAIGATMINVAAASLHPNDSRPRIVDHAATSSERTYALANHLVGGVIYITTAWTSFPFSVIVVLIMWLVRRHESPFLDDHGTEATNFRLSVMVYTLVLAPLAMLTLGNSAFACIPLFALNIYGVAQASIAANRGEFYRYPMCLRMIRSRQARLPA
jgi:hypothetical protein